MKGRKLEEGGGDDEVRAAEGLEVGGGDEEVKKAGLEAMGRKNGEKSGERRRGSKLRDWRENEGLKYRKEEDWKEKREMKE